MDDKLKTYINTIKAEIPYVDIKPYSHNIINLTLRSIGEQFGDDVAKRLIASTKLKDLGWGWVKPKLRADQKEGEEEEPVRLTGFEEMRSRTAKHASRTD